MTSLTTCTLPGCGAPLPRDGRHRLFCSEAHRVRAGRMRARGITLDDARVALPTDGAIYRVTRQQLDGSDVADTVLGRAALVLAAALDDPHAAPSALVAGSRQLPPTIAAALRGGGRRA